MPSTFLEVTSILIFVQLNRNRIKLDHCWPKNFLLMRVSKYKCSYGETYIKKLLFVYPCGFCSNVRFLLAAVRIQTFMDEQIHRMQTRGFSNRRHEIMFSFTTGKIMLSLITNDPCSHQLQTLAYSFVKVVIDSVYVISSWLTACDELFSHQPG